MIKPCIGYPGGKSKIAPLLCEYFPVSIQLFVEPFFGSGFLTFYHLQRHRCKQYLAVEKDPYLFNFWIHVQQKSDMLIQKLNHFHKKAVSNNNPKDFFLEIVEKYHNIDVPNSVYHAAIYYILNKISFSGLGPGISKPGKLRAYSLSSYKRWIQSPHSLRITQCSKVLSHVHLINGDYSLAFDEVKQHGTLNFYFFDPPYFNTTCKMYGKKGELHNTFDHIRFKQDCMTLNSPFLITYDDSEEVRELFKDFYIESVPVYYSMAPSNKKKDFKEVFIMNYKHNRTVLSGFAI